MKLFGRKIVNWKGIKEVPPEQRKEKILEAVGAFMKAVSETPVPVVGMNFDGQKFTGSDSSLVSGVAPIVMIQSDTPETPDRGYEVLFDEVDMRSSTSKTFDLLTVKGGVTFYQQLEGEEAKLSRLPTASKASVGFLRYTGGFAILDDWLRFNEYYKIDELTSDTVKNWWHMKAAIFYALVSALTGIDEAFDTDDVTTINNACANILTDLDAAGYAVDENASFYLLCHPLLKARMLKALAASYMNPNTNNNQLAHNVRGIISTVKMASTNYHVVLPGLKNKRGEWEDLNTRPPQRSELKLGADHVWTGAFNGAIGEKKQFKKCALSA